MAFSRVAGAAATGIKIERFKIGVNHDSFQPPTIRDRYDVHVTPCRRAICGARISDTAAVEFATIAPTVCNSLKHSVNRREPGADR